MTASFAAKPTSRQITRRAWGSFIEAWGSAAPLFLAAMLLSAALNVAVLYLTAPPMPTISLNLDSEIYLMDWRLLIPVLFRLPLSALIMAPAAVTIHRRILLDEMRGEIFARSTWLFFAWLLAFQVAMGAIFLAGVWLTRGAVTLSVIWVLLLGIVGIYLAMVFPAVAIDAADAGIFQRMRTSLAQMEGNFWRLFWAGFLALLPLVVLLIVITVGLRVLSVLHWEWANAIQMFLAALDGAAQIISLMLGAAVASWLYAWIRQNPVAP